METKRTNGVFLGLGGNLGKPLDNFAETRLQLSKHPGIEVRASSPLYRTPAVGGPAGQPDYLNAVLEIATALSPDQLLSFCRELEERCGRTREVQWGPRTLDIDLLFFAQQVSETPQLTLPHPHLHNRHFVLLPLVDLQPDLRHPRLEKTVLELLNNLPLATGISQISAQW